MLTTKQLAKLLQRPYRQTYRIAQALQYVKTMEKNKLCYHFQATHPLSMSCQLLKGSAKPLYTISEIAQLWQWRKGSYSPRRIRQLLFQYDITIYNQKNKGLVYLCDLQNLLQ